MHVFLDTNIFEKDPFWKNTYSIVLLEQAKKKRISLYMSVVVFEELKRHTIKNNKKEFKSYRAALLELNRYLPENATPIPANDVASDFDDFYAHLHDTDRLTVLAYKDNFLPTVMDRAIHRKKPFTEDKKEFKDCVIWLTYADYVELNNLSPCYFINANVSDFYAKEPLAKDPTEYTIHETLMADSSRFRCFPSIKDFVKIVLEPQLQANKQFIGWIHDHVNKAYVFDLVKSMELRAVEGKVEKMVENWSINRLFADKEWAFTGFCQLNDIEWIECTELNIDLLEDSAIVSATVALQIIVEGQAYNPVHDDGDDKYSYIGEKDISVSVNVTFILRENDTYDSFTIDYIENSRD